MEEKEKQMRQLMYEHTRHLVRIAYLYVKDWDAAEDIVQEVFIKHYETMHYYEGRASIRTYLTRMTVNRCKDYLKRWSTRKTYLFEIITAKVSGSERQLVEQEEQNLLQQAIFSMPMKYREVIILFYYDEQSIAEIASFLKCNENTVKTRLARGRKLLKALLEDVQLEVLGHE